MAEARRGKTLTGFAALFALLAASNILKPVRLLGEETGFVFFGERLGGMANAVAGPLFGAYLIVYVIGIWRMKRFAIALAYVYATYVVLNLVLFSVRNQAPPGMAYKLFMVVYATIAIGVSGGCALMLTKRKAELS